MRHRRFESLIDAYICDELPEKEQTPFEEHMLACKSCREKLLLSQAIADGIKVYGEELLAATSSATEPSLAQRIRQRIRGFIPDLQPVPLAVSLILVVAAIGILLYGLWPHSRLNTYIHSFFPTAFKDQRIEYYENKYGVLDPRDPRSRMTHAIFKRLTQVAGQPKAASLRLVVLKDCPEIAISLPDGHIVIGDGAIERCRKILKDPSHVEAGLALIQGHEISHFLNGDFGMHRLNEFIDPKSGFLKALRIKDREMADIIRAQEHRADIQGILLASLAGYDVSPLLKEEGFLVQWARATTLPEDDLHPNVEERQEAIRNALIKVRRESHAFFLGLRLIQIGRYDQAIQALEHFSREYPGKEVFLDLGVAYHLWSLSINPNEPIYKRSISIAPDISIPVEGLKGLRGPTDEAEGKKASQYLGQAIAYYNRALDMDPTDPALWHNLACGYADQGENLDLALGHVTEALRLDHNYYQAYNTRATVYLAQKRVDEALSDCNRALQSEGYSDTLYNLAYYYAEDQNNTLYLDYLKKYLSLDFRSAWAQKAISWQERFGLEKPAWIIEAQDARKEWEEKFLDLHEEIEGKAPGDLITGFVSWDVPDEKYDISFQDAYCEVWIYKTSPKGIKVTFMDQKVVLIEAGPVYTGSTSEGISIGDPVDKIYSNDTYGRPLTIFWCLGRQVILYPLLGVGFEIEESRVRGWFLFERSWL